LARVFAVMVQIILRAGAVAVQSFIKAANISPVTNFGGCTGAVSLYNIVSEPEICQGAGIKLRADARVRV